MNNFKETEGLIYIKVNFKSEYPEASAQELEAIIYNTLVAHEKINKVESIKSYIYYNQPQVVNNTSAQTLLQNNIVNV